MKKNRTDIERDAYLTVSSMTAESAIAFAHKLTWMDPAAARAVDVGPADPTR